VDAKPGEDKPAKPDEKDPNKPQTPEDQFGTEDDGKPAEKKATSRYFLGARFRDFVAPNFIFGLFADGGPDVVNVFSGGPEFMLNTGALEVIFSVTVPYADYSMDEFLFKAKSDPERAFEFASSSLKLITASVDLLGRIPIDDKGTVAFLIGGGVGISGVLGDIYRNQVAQMQSARRRQSGSRWWRLLRHRQRSLWGVQRTELVGRRLQADRLPLHRTAAFGARGNPGRRVHGAARHGLFDHWVLLRIGRRRPTPDLTHCLR
jgi:hypothetical protein